MTKDFLHIRINRSLKERAKKKARKHEDLTLSQLVRAFLHDYVKPKTKTKK